MIAGGVVTKAAEQEGNRKLSICNGRKKTRKRDVIDVEDN